MEEIKRNARWKILDTRSKDANFRDQGSISLLKREKVSILRGSINEIRTINETLPAEIREL